MARTLYFDCFSGVSGDMVLGAALDLGLPLDGLRAALGSLAIDYGRITAERVLRSGVAATKFRVVAPGTGDSGHPGEDVERRQPVAHGHAHDQGHRRPQVREHGHEHEPAHQQGREGQGHHAHAHHSLEEIARFIERSDLTRAGKDRAIHLFRRLGEAEAAIHDMPLERVHLHEVGALDSIIDIVGAVYAMEWLGADRIVASPLNVGSGTATCAHGVLPVPAPATTRLLRGAPVYAGAVVAELVTPTGALIVTDYASQFGTLPAMRLQSVGYGAGDRDHPGHPNVLRLILGESLDARPAMTILVVECEIDDMNPQLFGPLMDRLFSAGAVDVFYAGVQMKKNRPGTLVTVMAPPERRDEIVGLLFAETTTIGVRYQEVARECLARDVRTLDTPLGAIRFKVAMRDGRVVNAAPEFDDCVRVAAERGLPVKDVLAIATKAWLDQGGRR